MPPAPESNSAANGEPDRANSFVDRLHHGDLLLGHFVLEFFTAGVGPMLDSCGLDFVIFDMEHGRCDISLVAEMAASCRGSRIFPIARVSDASFAPLSRILDLGIRGVMAPRVETRQQAEDIVCQLKYAPRGRRGVALGIAHDLYRAGTAEYFAQANRETCVALMLETERAFENLDEILSVPGIDIAWVGQYDLTVSMGIPTEFDHPRCLAAMDALVAACDRNGIAPGFMPATRESAVDWIGKGFRAIALGSDIGVFLDGIRRFRAHVTHAASRRLREDGGA